MELTQRSGGAWKRLASGSGRRHTRPGHGDSVDVAGLSDEDEMHEPHVTEGKR